MDPVTAMALAGGAGSLIDAGLGFFGAQEQSDQQREAARRLLAGISDARDIYGDTFNEVSGMYDPYVERGEQAYQDMTATERQLDPSLYKLPEMQEFQYDQGVEDFLNPAMDFQMQQGQRALEGSAAAAGGLLSGKTLLDLQRQSQGLASQEYGNAWDRMQQDKNFAYSDYLNRFNAARESVQDRYQKMTDKYGRAGAQYDIGRGAVGTQAGLRNNLGQSMANLRTQEANVQAQQAQIPNWLQNLAGQSEKIGSSIGSFGGMFGQSPKQSIEGGIPATQSIASITG